MYPNLYLFVKENCGSQYCHKMIKGLLKEKIRFMKKGCKIQNLEVIITNETYLIYSFQQRTCLNGKE